jgi:hypothetical protein
LNKHQENWRFFRWCQRADKKLRFKKAEYEVSRFVLKTFSFLNLALPLQWKYFRYHEPISTLKKSDYDGYLKFCIICNPVDRMISNYFFHRQKNNILQKASFGPFSEYAKVVMENHLLLPQTHYITSHNVNVMDELILFENIEDDFMRICQILDIDLGKIGLPHSNKSNREELLIDDETLRCINHYYSEDLILYQSLKTLKEKQK